MGGVLQIFQNWATYFSILSFHHFFCLKLEEDLNESCQVEKVTANLDFSVWLTYQLIVEGFVVHLNLIMLSLKDYDQLLATYFNQYLETCFLQVLNQLDPNRLRKLINQLMKNPKFIKN